MTRFLYRYTVYVLLGGGGYVIGIAHGRWFEWLGVVAGIAGWLVLERISE